MSKEKKTSDIMIRKIPAELKKKFHLYCVTNDYTMRQAFLEFMECCAEGKVIKAYKKEKK